MPDSSEAQSKCFRKIPAEFGSNEIISICLSKRSGIRDQGSGIRDQGSGIRDQGSGIRDQGSGIRDQGSGIRDQGSVIKSGFGT
jgi:hypothetical protein